jgi:hypothetical protein
MVGNAQRTLANFIFCYNPIPDCDNILIEYPLDSANVAVRTTRLPEYDFCFSFDCDTKNHNSNLKQRGL